MLSVCGVCERRYYFIAWRVVNIAEQKIFNLQLVQLSYVLVHLHPFLLNSAFRLLRCFSFPLTPPVPPPLFGVTGPVISLTLLKNVAVYMTCCIVSGSMLYECAMCVLIISFMDLLCDLRGAIDSS